MTRARAVVTGAVADVHARASDAAIAEFEQCLGDARYSDAFRAARRARANCDPHTYEKRVAAALETRAIPGLLQCADLPRAALAAALAELPIGTAGAQQLAQRLAALDSIEVAALLAAAGPAAAREWVNSANPPHAAALHALIEFGGGDGLAPESVVAELEVLGGIESPDDGWDALVGAPRSG
jgi:hypothetical protein